MTPPCRLRVLHVRTVRGTGGGPDKTVLHSCRWLRARGHVAAAFYITDPRHDSRRLLDLAGELGVRLVTSEETSPISPRTPLALSREIARGRYDVIHTHEYKSNVLAQVLRAWHAYRIVATAHGYNRTTRREAVYYGVERACLRRVAAVIAPNRAMYSQMRRLGVPANRLHVIHNGIRTAGLTPPAHTASPGPKRLVYLGRLSAEKDPANAVRALAELVRAGTDAQLTLAGAGPERDAVAALAAELDLADRVHLPGFVADVMGLLADADILVSSSKTECMPNSLLEAMWAGVPVVATAVGGVAEMVRHEVDGLLCPSDDPSALAGQIRRMLTQPGLAEKLTRSASRRVRNAFTFEGRMERVLALYGRVLGTSGPCASGTMRS